MALIDRNRQPTSHDLRVFGVLFAVFCPVLGALVLYRVGSWAMVAMIWTLGLLVSVLYYVVPTTRTMIFQAWMTAVFPIGWLISHSLLAVIYYGLITPLGIALKLLTGDFLHQEKDPLTSSYWVSCTSSKDIGRYFQQF